MRCDVRVAWVGTSPLALRCQLNRRSGVFGARPARQGGAARASPAFQMTQTFELDAGRATRTFTLHERDGVILINRDTVIHGCACRHGSRHPRSGGCSVF